MINPKLGLKDQPWIVLQVLSTAAVRHETHTAAWYNGRECGFSILTGIGTGKRTVITCVEDRNSYRIAVDHWECAGSWLDPPTPQDMPKTRNGVDWRENVNRRHFDCGAFAEAAKYIVDLIDGGQS